MAIIDFEECPCSGKNISTLVAPWILLTLYENEGTHGYEIQKMILTRLLESGYGLNAGGLYRHLNTLEKRGVLTSNWDTSAPGPARRRYFLTDAGKECLWRWVSTLSVHVGLIGKFMDEAQRVFSNAELPKVVISAGPACGPR
jgi:DNA-binding PadR family transcriptional regulator